MDHSTKSRLAIDLDALEAQLKNVHNQQPARRPRSNDPLAELARIVGQDDPYRAILANERAEAPVEDPARRKRRREPTLFDSPPANENLPEAQPHGVAMDESSYSLEHLNQDAGREALAKGRGPARMPSAEFEATLRGILGERHEPGAQQPAHSLRDFMPPPPIDHAASQAEASADGTYEVAEARYDEQAEAVEEDQGQYAGEEEAEPRRSRKGLVAAAALVGVGAIAVGGFYFSRGSGARTASGEPPVIMAEKQPTKVQAKAADDPGQSKQIYETVKQSGATQEQGTRVVNRDEQPLDLNQILKRDGQTASLPSGQRGITLPQPPQASNLGKQDEPRKVKTVAVRPDGSIVSEGQSAEPALARGVAPAQPSRPLFQAQGDGLVQGQPAVQSQSQSQPQGQSQPQVQLPSQQRQNGSPATPSLANGAAAKSQARVGDSSERTESRDTGRGVSLGVSPVGNSQKPPEQVQAQGQPVQSRAPSQPQAEAKPQQRAAVPPQSQEQSQPARRVAAAPADTASQNRATEVSADGAFVVQLKAASSEQEARETFASMQRKHSELGGRRPIIRQAQVGGKTLWRLRVATTSKEDAVTLCTKLQAAGGACFVTKN